MKSKIKKVLTGLVKLLSNLNLGTSFSSFYQKKLCNKSYTQTD